VIYRILLIFFITCFQLYAKTEQKLWEELITLADPNLKVKLLNEGTELNYTLPDSWKSLWEEPTLRPYLLELASPSQLTELHSNSSLTTWPSELRRQLWIKCWFLKKNNEVPQWIILNHTNIIKEEATWLLKSPSPQEPTPVDGDPLTWSPIECQAHLSKNWESKTISIILSSDRYDLNLALSNACLIRKEKITNELIHKLWSISSSAGKSALAHILLKSPEPNLQAFFQEKFHQNDHPVLCLKILKAMNTPPIATWLLDQFKNEHKPWMPLALHFMIERRDVEISRRYLDLYEGPLVKKSKIPIGEVVILMGMSKHTEVIPILNKLLRSKKSPVGVSYVIQAMAEHGDPSFLKTLERKSKTEGSSLVDWAIERLKGLHEKPFSTPPSQVFPYRPSFRVLP